MDISEFADSEGYRPIFNQLKEYAADSARHEGEIPDYHVPPEILVPGFMRSVCEDLQFREKKKIVYPTSVIPPPYPPSVRPVQELSPLMIRQMALEHHHRGSLVLVRALTLFATADRAHGLKSVVEDEQGTAALLVLYNHPEEVKLPMKRGFKTGDVFLVKEPFFRTTMKGQFSLRVDHASDIIRLEDPDDRIPLKWRRKAPHLNKTSQQIREQGNVAAKKKEWAEAERLYTKSILAALTPEESNPAYLNRSLANLRLGRAAKALDDAIKGGVDNDGPTEIGLFRQAIALYGLQRFQECMDMLTRVVRLNPANTEAWDRIKKVKHRLNEEKDGVYDYGRMFAKPDSMPSLIECATYIGSIAVRESAGRGLGLFTTKPVKAGDLLLCEKAFAYCYAGKDDAVGQSNMGLTVDLNTETVILGGQTKLAIQIVEKLLHDPDNSTVFTSLYSGDYTPVRTKMVDGIPVVDACLIAKIIKLNSFGAPRVSSVDHFDALMGEKGTLTGEGLDAHYTCGIWPVASRINHSCITNCRRSFAGDMMLVRACQDLEANQELFFRYKAPKQYQTYRDTQNRLRNWGFVCDCALCLAKRSTLSLTIDHRRQLMNAFHTAMTQRGDLHARWTQAQGTVKDLEKTYRRSEEAPWVPRVELPELCLPLGMELRQNGRVLESLELILKGLKALGFRIIACPPRRPSPTECLLARQPPKLRVKQWGQMNPLVTEAFFQLMYIYDEIAPELSSVAYGYAMQSNSICHGDASLVPTAPA